LQPQFLVFAVVRHVVRGAHGAVLGAVAAALAHVGAEWAFPKLFADTLGHGFYASVLMRQAADVAGAHGLTFAILLANECFAAAWRRGRSGARVARVLAPIVAAVAIAGTLATYGAMRLDNWSGWGARDRSPQPSCRETSLSTSDCAQRSAPTKPYG
jgi:apolipoprotein N-acyltransferase